MTVYPTEALRAGFHALVRRVSRNYVAGPSLLDARRVLEPLVSRGYSITLGYWNSAEDSAGEVLRKYLSSGEELARLPGDNYLSIKIPALRYDARMFRELLEQTGGRGVGLLFDALDIRHATLTFDFISKHALAGSGEIGCALPGRWRRSLEDAERAIELGLAVRVVKGQSPDPADPDRDPRTGYLNVVRMLAGRARRVRVASHDPHVARESLRILTNADTPCELELLYGLPVGNQVALAREFGVPVRVYVAFGHAFLPYAVTSLRKSPASILRLLRETARGDCLSTFPALRIAPPP